MRFYDVTSWSYVNLGDPAMLTGLNTFTSFDAPSRDICGWSMQVQRVIRHVHKTSCLRSSSLLTLGMSMVQRRQMEALSRGYDTVVNVWTV